MGAQLRHGLVEEDVEGVKVRSHQSVVDTEESQVRRTVEEVGQRDEGVSCLHVEQEDGCKERHALDVADVGTVTGVRPQDVMEWLVVGTTLW